MTRQTAFMLMLLSGERLVVQSRTSDGMGDQK
jgi:hypothetical protein